MAGKGTLHCEKCFVFYQNLHLNAEHLTREHMLAKSRDRQLRLSEVFTEAHQAFCRSKGIPMCQKCGSPHVYLLKKARRVLYKAPVLKSSPETHEVLETMMPLDDTIEVQMDQMNLGESAEDAEMI